MFKSLSKQTRPAVDSKCAFSGLGAPENQAKNKNLGQAYAGASNTPERTPEATGSAFQPLKFRGPQRGYKGPELPTQKGQQTSPGKNQTTPPGQPRAIATVPKLATKIGPRETNNMDCLAQGFTIGLTGKPWTLDSEPGASLCFRPLGT